MSEYEIGNDQAYLKLGLYGQQGAGKTFTASKIAIGLHEYIHSKKPVFFQDTETGSSFVKKTLFDPAGVKLIGKRSKSFADLVDAAVYAEKNADIMIVDSLTHIWVDLCESYRKKKYVCEKCAGTGQFQGKDCYRCGASGSVRDRLSIWDYAPIKKTWGTWVDFFVNSKLHMIVCGRAGGKYELRENAEGKEEITKVDETFKSESEYGYECSILAQLKPVKSKNDISNTMFIWKDRFNVLNGHEIVKPTFDDILPHVQLLNLGGEHIGTVEGKDTVAMLKTPKANSEDYEKQKTILLEEIQALMMLKFTAATDDKRAKMELLKTIFGSMSWTGIEQMKLDQLQQGLENMRKHFEDKDKAQANGQGKAKSEVAK